MAMGRSYRRVDRDQAFLLPPDMREWLPDEHLVWFVVDVVDGLDTSAFHARHPQSGPGRRAFDPDMLLAVLLYGYMVGERSSRQIERLCSTDVAFRVLCGGDVPDHTRFARFRKEYQDLFADVFEQVLMMCARAGMGRVGVVAIDGTKIAANASAGATRSERSLRKELAVLQAAARDKARDIVAQAEQVDALEDEELGEGVRGGELAPQFKDPSTRAAAIAAALAEIEKAKAADAQAAAQKAVADQEYLNDLREGRARPGAVPKGVDPVEAARARVVLHEQRAAQATDRAKRNEARKAARRAQVKLDALQDSSVRDQDALAADDTKDTKDGKDGTRYQANVTDPDSRVMKTRTGWIQGFNAQLAVSDDHLILAVGLTQDTNDQAWFAPMMDAAVAAVERIQDAQGVPAHEVGIGTVLADAGYFSEDNLTAQGPDRLIASGTRHDMSSAVAADPTSGSPPQPMNPRDAMRYRLRDPDNARLYTRRGATVEPVNAHLKDGAGLRRFARRGLNAATSELNLAAASVNLNKLFRRTVLPA